MCSRMIQQVSHEPKALSKRVHQAAATPISETSTFFTPVSSASLGVFRIGLGVILLIEMSRFLLNDWVRADFVTPALHFTYHGFAWVRPLPEPFMTGLFLTLGVCAAMITLGWQYRVAMPLFAVGFAYVFLIDKALYLNHFYLVILLSIVMCAVPAHRRYSVDAWRNPSLAAGVVPAWALWLLRAQIAIPYVYGGIAKFNGDWLAGQPLQLWMSRMTHLQALVPQFGTHELALVFCYGGLLLDLLVVPLLLWKRTRIFAFIAAVAFHLLNALMFKIGIFPWLMILATTLFLAPDWPERWWRQLPRRKSSNALHPADRQAFAGPWGRAALIALTFFFGVQVVLPLRHWLLPGKVDWTEAGARFSWRMMLNDKTSAVVFIAVDPSSGEKSPIDIRRYLTPRQLDKMSYDPEMVREFAAFLGRKIETEQGRKLEIHAIVFCTLNGRHPQLLVDPTIDLAAEPRAWHPGRYVVPLTQPLLGEPFLLPPDEWGPYLTVPVVHPTSEPSSG